MTTFNEPSNLEELLEILKANGDWAGSPQNHGELDYSSLPTFGGDEPSNAAGIWSWDEDSVIMGSCSDDFCIESRSDIFN